MAVVNIRLGYLIKKKNIFAPTDDLVNTMFQSHGIHLTSVFVRCRLTLANLCMNNNWSQVTFELCWTIIKDHGGNNTFVGVLGEVGAHLLGYFVSKCISKYLWRKMQKTVSNRTMRRVTNLKSLLLESKCVKSITPVPTRPKTQYTPSHASGIPIHEVWIWSVSCWSQNRLSFLPCTALQTQIFLAPLRWWLKHITENDDNKSSSGTRVRSCSNNPKKLALGMSGMSPAGKSKKLNVLLVTLSVRSVSAEHMCEWLVYVDDALQSQVTQDTTSFLLCVRVLDVFPGRGCTTLHSAGWSAVMTREPRCRRPAVVMDHWGLVFLGS